MDSKLIGGILLIVGTSIGAGMLALPIAASHLGFTGSLVLLLGCWFVMTAAALLLLEVNLWLPENSNLFSMAKATIGPSGQVIAWGTYLLLLYSLICAYIAGGSDLFHSLVSQCGVEIPRSVSSFIFTALFGSIVYLGIRSIDYVNRGLMFVKLSAFLLLVVFLTPIVSTAKLATGNIASITSATAITVTVTSFGFAIVVPSLRVYFKGDVKKLRLAILIGSLIPLICYIAWDAVIMGIIPLEGSGGLQTILQSNNSTSDLVNTLNNLAATDSISMLTRIFTSICVLTSFLGVSLCLSDFIADSFSLEKKGKGNAIIFSATFLPPFLIVLVSPGIFVTALQYAGIYVTFILIILPAWMAWSGRYRRGLSNSYVVRGGKALVSTVMLLGLVIIVRSLADI